MRNTLMTYIADKGSCVINGIGFSNGIGDGHFKVYVFDSKPENTEELAWIDLRDNNRFGIWDYDCDPSTITWFTNADVFHADAIGIGFDKDGNACLWKLF